MVYPIVLLSIEIILVSIFSFKNYLKMSNMQKSLWRIACVIAPLLLTFKSYQSSQNYFTTLFLISFILILISDIALVYNFFLGIGLFLVYHIINGVNFSLLVPDFSCYALLHGIVAFVGAAALFSVFFLKKAKGVLLLLILIYTLVLTYAVWRSLIITIDQRTIPSFFLYSGALLFFVCDLQVAYVFLSKSLTNFNHNVNNIIYYSAISLLALGVYSY